MQLSNLPALNASLNALASILLICGFISIKKGNKKLHIKLMMSAFLVSSLFLASYLYYHFHFPTKKFPDLGWIKTLYYLVLFPHIILAVAMLPMIFLTFKRAFKQDWEAHKRIARLTFPVWTYVSITGVLIYFMLYVWFA